MGISFNIIRRVSFRSTLLYCE